jgi:hypothetical protein
MLPENETRQARFGSGEHYFEQTGPATSPKALPVDLHSAGIGERSDS